MSCNDPKAHADWTSQGQQCPQCGSDEPLPDQTALAAQVVDELERRYNFERDVVRRLVRLEMRNTLALRNLGLVPGRDEERNLPAAQARLVQNPYGIAVDRMDVPLRDIARVAALEGLTRETPIYYNGEQIGLYYPK